jgi:hypothetical protein
MASAAVLSNCLAVSSCVRTIMTPETSRKIHVAQIVWIGTPGYLQVREDIAVVDRENRLPCLGDVLSTLSVIRDSFRRSYGILQL